MTNKEKELYQSLLEDAQRLQKSYNENHETYQERLKKYSKNTLTIETLKEEAYEYGINIDNIVSECKFDVTCVRKKLDDLINTKGS